MSESTHKPKYLTGMILSSVTKDRLLEAVGDMFVFNRLPLESYVTEQDAIILEKAAKEVRISLEKKKATSQT
jgi:hypothetical protein